MTKRYCLNSQQESLKYNQLFAKAYETGLSHAQ